MPYKDPEARRVYQREWAAARRAEYLADKACVVCNSRDRMEIDHIDRSTKVSHRVWSWSADRRAAELAKCQVLCHDHHLAKTIEESSHPTRSPHGTHSRYRRGCRCPECRAGHLTYKQEWRAARRAAGLPAP